MGKFKVSQKYREIGKPYALSSAERLKQHFQKIPIGNIKKGLQSFDSYTITRVSRKNYPKNYYFITKIGGLVEVDLLELGKLSKVNSGVRYLLVAIDVFSKYLVVEPLKRKTTAETSEALKKVLKKFPFPVVNMQSDSGSEWKGEFQNVLKEHNVKFRNVLNPPIKAAVVERVIRTLKRLITQYRLEFNSDRFIHNLQKIVLTYNSRIHSTIAIPPNKVNKFNEKSILLRYKRKWSKLKKVKPIYKIGQHVRISKYKTIFGKESEGNFTREIFRVAGVNTSLPLPMYFLKDLNNEIIRGQFLSSELQPVNKKERYEIEKIIRKRKVNGQTEYLIKWLGYSSNFNSWIPESEVKNI